MEFQFRSVPKGYVRAFHLENGTIFTINTNKQEHTLEFEENMLYEVVFKGYDEWIQSIWERTGNTFTIDEINILTK